ncbi:hypothetical protein Tco_0581298 [Tanacetum coccineum]
MIRMRYSVCNTIDRDFNAERKLALLGSIFAYGQWSQAVVEAIGTLDLIGHVSACKSFQLEDLLGLIHKMCVDHLDMCQERSRTALGKKFIAIDPIVLSFWDYALESAVRILNMVPTKKVDKTPYEIWHGKVPNMSYLTDEEKAYMKRVPYASAVGSIMYAVRCTRPDVAFAQNLVSRYQQNPGKLHWVAVKHILKYLRNTKDMFLTGYVFVVNGGAVDWKSKKQTTIAMHATQSEYMAASEAAMEAVWIRKFVEDLGVMPSISKPINMYCDNSAAIIFANEPGVMKGARHFLRRYHYVREQVGVVNQVIKVHTDKNLLMLLLKL